MLRVSASGTAADEDESSRVNRARLLFAVSLVGVFLYLALDGVAQWFQPHYNPITQAESELAVGPYGYVMTLNFINRGILSLTFLFAVMLAANSNDVAGPRLRRGAWLFSLWSIGALLLAAFPTDVPPVPVSWHGAVHLAVALAAFFGGAFGALYVSLGMAGNKTMGKAKGVALPLACLSVVLLAAEIFGGMVPGIAAQYGGLIERMFLGSVLLWIASVSVVMLEKPVIRQAN